MVDVRDMDDKASADAAAVNRPRDLHPPHMFMRADRAGAASFSI